MVEVMPCANSRVFEVPIVTVAARVDPIVGINMRAATPSAILRLRVSLFFP